jgi:universal stress protein A
VRINSCEEGNDVSDYKNILVAADFSAGGEAAARQAANLAERLGANLTILHVLEHFPEDLPVDVIPPEDVDPQTYLADRIRGQLEKLRAAIGHPEAALEIVISTHSANREIVQFAQNKDIDLIVVGCHDQHGFMGTPGSTANGVVHAASVDVLAVRAKG